jgi:molybdenum cofactor guanylyltransferase
VYHQRVTSIAAFILAGGRSSRMGKDKAFLEFGGRSLIQRAMDLASSLAIEVRIVGDRRKFLTIGPTVEDAYPDCGPLGGIHAALSKTSQDLNLILAVDLPFVERNFLIYLISQASQTNALVTVPHAGGGWQPLCAVYRKEFAEVAERALKKKKNKIDALFSIVETRQIGEGELERMGFSARMFLNLNAPADFEEAKKLLGSR